MRLKRKDIDIDSPLDNDNETDGGLPSSSSSSSSSSESSMKRVRQQSSRLGLLQSQWINDVDNSSSNNNSHEGKNEEEVSTVMPVCRVCATDKNDANLLTCGCCLALFHTYCLVPKLKKIPEEIWFCDECLTNKPTSKSNSNSNSKSKSKAKAKASIGDVKSSAIVAKTEEINKKWNEQIDSGVCLVCLLDDNPSKTLVCDGCLDQYHTYCLTPKLKSIPVGDWFCRNCHIKWNEKIDATVCRVCSKDNNEAQLLVCDGCLDQYHLYCLVPKLKNVPKGDWFCQHCKTKGQSKIISGSTYIEAVSTISTKADKSEPITFVTNGADIEPNPNPNPNSSLNISQQPMLNVFHINSINYDINIYNSSNSALHVPQVPHVPRYYKSSRSKSGFRTLRAKPMEPKNDEDRVVNSSSSEDEEEENNHRKVPGKNGQDGVSHGQKDESDDDADTAILFARRNKAKLGDKSDGKSIFASKKTASNRKDESSRSKSAASGGGGSGSGSQAKGLIQDCDFGYYTYNGVCKWNDIKHPGNFRYVGYFKDSKSKIHLIKGFYDTSIEAAMARDDFLIRNAGFMKLNTDNSLNFVRNKSPANEISEGNGGVGGGSNGDNDGDGNNSDSASVVSVDCEAIEAIIENSSNIFEDFCLANFICVCGNNFKDSTGLRRHRNKEGCF